MLIRASDNAIKSAADLSGKNVGSQLGSAGAQVAQKFKASLKARGKAGFTELKLYEHYPEAYADLWRRKASAI